MYNNSFYNPSFNLERLNKMKDDIERQIQSCQSNQQQPINNYINTNQPQSNMYELKKLNEGDEVENIFVNNDAIFIGTNRMQIKKIDGTIEKYNIEKYYPIYEKDEQIKELNKKVEELERKLNNEHSNTNTTTREFNKSNGDANGNVEPKSKTTSKSVSKQI
jgi:TolA-binding protein